jgi:multiple sugar transport system permease protein/putative aldouronate transport system permease protein
VIICVIPFWLVLINSFADEGSLLKLGFQLFPAKISLEGYSFLLKGMQIYRSYGVTILVTTVGSSLAIMITSSFAYAISHKRMKYGYALSLMTFVTRILGVGLVGFYILVSIWLHLRNSLWALILPYLLNPFNTFILISFFRSLPDELNEAAYLDGANEIRIFFQIVLPISMTAFATVMMFYALQYWNDWWLALLFVDNYKLNPLQIMIRELISITSAGIYGNYGDQNIPGRTLQLGTVCLTIGPIILLYPFVQRFFVKGITIGAVKG